MNFCSQYCHLLGDYNINLLRTDDHLDTSNFVDLMYSYMYIPLITKPSRITEKSATLIDNVFTNAIHDTGIIQGLLYTDISDHLPVFAIFAKIKDNSVSNKEEFIFKRRFHPDKVKKFHEALQYADWDVISNNTIDPQHAFTAFHSHFMKLYNKHFPLQKIKIGYKHVNLG